MDLDYLAKEGIKIFEKYIRKDKVFMPIESSLPDSKELNIEVLLDKSDENKTDEEIKDTIIVPACSQLAHIVNELEDDYNTFIRKPCTKHGSSTSMQIGYYSILIVKSFYLEEGKEKKEKVNIVVKIGKIKSKEVTAS